jgi:hypothetical protein
MSSLQVKPLSFWKLMLRDGLNLYAVSPFFLFLAMYVGFDACLSVVYRDCQPRQRYLLVRYPAYRSNGHSQDNRN